MKPKFYFDVEQHIFDVTDKFNFQTSPEWLELRANRLTASFASELLAKGKSSDGLGKSIKKRLAKRLMQKWTGWVDDESVSWQDKEAVLRGIQYESEALEWYQLTTGRNTVPCGFVERGKYLGCSPDSFVVDGEGIAMAQIKIPMPGNFIDAIMDYSEYISQIEMELFVCDLEKSDLVIYSPELKTGKIIPVRRNRDTDREILSKMKAAVRFQRAVTKEINRLRGEDDSNCLE